VAKRFFLNQNSNLNYLTYDFENYPVRLKNNKPMLRSLENLEELGTDNLVLFFNLILNTNSIAHYNTLEHYDL
jgi:hypothetical protein